MKTILVPTDFSSTANNSLHYAVQYAQAIGANRLILFNAYNIPLATEMSWALQQTEELEKMSLTYLNEQKEKLEQINSGVEICTISRFGFLVKTLLEVIAEERVDLVVMGITGGNKLEEVLVGSNTTMLAHELNVPLIIVPAQAVFNPIKKIGWACDFEKIVSTAPIEEIKSVLHQHQASFFVVHNSPNVNDPSAEVFTGSKEVLEVFRELHPSFVLMEEKVFEEAIVDFEKQYEIDLLIIIPKKHNWIETLFRRGHTKRLAFHTHIPIYCLPPKS